MKRQTLEQIITQQLSSNAVVAEDLAAEQIKSYKDENLVEITKLSNYRQYISEKKDFVKTASDGELLLELLDMELGDEIRETLANDILLNISNIENTDIKKLAKNNLMMELLR